MDNIQIEYYYDLNDVIKIKNIQLIESCISKEFSKLNLLTIPKDKLKVKWDSALLEAYKTGDIKIINLIKENIQKYHHNFDGNIDEILYGACKNGNKFIIMKLILGLSSLPIGLLPLTQNKILKAINKGLEGACEGNHLNIIGLMIEHGACDWNLGFIGACRGGHLNIVKLMLDKNPNIDLNIGMFDACYSGNLDLVLYLVKNGVDNWNFGLLGACRGGYIDIVQLMIESGAHNLKHGIQNACLGGYLEIVEYLLDLEEEPLDLEDLLENACLGGSIEIVRLIVSKMIENNIKLPTKLKIRKEIREQIKTARIIY